VDFPQVKITTRDAKIGLNIQNAQIKMKQHKAEVSIQQPQAEQTIRQHPPKLRIDQTNAWSNLGLKSIIERTNDTAQHANQVHHQGLARIAREGDELMSIESGGNPIASQAKRNSGWNFDYKPGGMTVHDLVSFNYEPGRAEISTKRQEPVIEATPRKPQLQYQRGNVSVQTEQYADVQIDVENLKFKGTQGFEITI